MKTQRILLSGLACMLIAACGVTETATTAAVVAGGKAKEVEQGKQQMERIQQQLDATNQQAQAQRQAAESAAQ